MPGWKCGESGQRMSWAEQGWPSRAFTPGRNLILIPGPACHGLGPPVIAWAWLSNSSKCQAAPPHQCPSSTGRPFADEVMGMKAPFAPKQQEPEMDLLCGLQSPGRQPQLPPLCTGHPMFN
jgi:hypothetical protein